MSREARAHAFGWLLLALLAAPYVAWGLAPQAAPFREPLTPRVLLALSSLLKIALLTAAALTAFACRDRLEPGNPARPAWALLSAGLFATLVGQLCLAPYQLVSGRTPFPTVADLFYMLSYTFFISAFLVFLRAYREAGFPVGSPLERAAIVAGVGLLAAVAGIYVLGPVAGGDGEPLARILSIAYAALDLVLLLPLALLLRIAQRLGGSRVGTVWAVLLAGFVFLCVGDVAFAYFSALGEQHLDPWVHVTYLLSYGLVALGTQRQLELLRA